MKKHDCTNCQFTHAERNNPGDHCYMFSQEPEACGQYTPVMDITRGSNPRRVLQALLDAVAFNDKTRLKAIVAELGNDRELWPTKERR